MNKEPNFIASLGTNEDRLKWWQKNGIMPSERILIEQKAELKGIKEGKEIAISEFKEKLKDKLFYGDYLHFKKDEKKIISNLLNKTAQEIK